MLVSLSLRLSLLALGLSFPSYTSAAPSEYTANTHEYGCGGSLPPDLVAGGPSQNFTIQSGGLQRSYLIYLPQSYMHKPSQRVPLILSFHGRTKDAAEQEGLSQFSNPNFNQEAIAIYPQGVANAKGTRQWTGDPDAPASINDIQFTLDLIKNLTATYCINPKRVYATGKSNGAALVGLLACDPEASSQIAAFAPVSGAFYLGILGAPNGSLPECKPSRKPIPFLDFHGFLDTTIQYNGGANGGTRGITIPIPEYMNLWAERNGFEADKNETSIVCRGTGFEDVIKHSWGDGILQHWNETGLRHTWPSPGPNDDDSSGRFETCFEGAQVIMDFFTGYTL